jgi:hypothetical protein
MGKLIERSNYMRGLHEIIPIIVLSLAFIQGQAIALDWTSGNYTIPDDWANDPEPLNTYDNVTVTILGGGGVAHFNMYDNSQLTMYGGWINELNLYPNATATLFGADYIGHLWVDPASTGLVKIYATELIVDPWYDHVEIKWPNKEGSYIIGLLGGESTYDHIQFIPEPASAVIFALGAALIASRRKRR